MKSIVHQLQDTVKLEEKKNANDKSFRELEQLIAQMDELGYSQKPNYTFPLVDTISKTIYPTLNKHLS
jgi:hypothetical protein